MEMAENWDVVRGPPNVTNSGSVETVGSGLLIQERLQLTPDNAHGQLCTKTMALPYRQRQW